MTKDLLIGQLNGQRVQATVLNMMCVEDIDRMRDILIQKYGSIESENTKSFKAGGVIYPKPRLERVRVGVFIVDVNRFYILNESNQRSYGSLSNLVVINGALNYMIDAVKDYRIKYETV